MAKNLLFAIAFLTAFQARSQFFEGFEDGSYNPATGNWFLNSGTWTISDNGVGLVKSWEPTTIVATPPFQAEGSVSAYINRENIGEGNTSEDWLVSPSIAVSPDALLTFFTRTAINGNQGTYYDVRVSTTSATDHSSFTTVDAWTESDVSPYFNFFTLKSIPLNAYAGQTVYIAFVRRFTQATASLSGDRWIIDAISVDGIGPFFNHINGTVSYGATAAECMPLPSTQLFPMPISVTANGNPMSILNYNGHYGFNTQEANVAVTVVTPPYFIVDPPFQTYNFTGTGNYEIANFCLQPNGLHPDLEVVIFTNACVKPGYHNYYSIVVRNRGTETQSGSVTFNFNDALSDYVPYGNLPDNQAPGNLTWNFTNLEPLTWKRFNVRLQHNEPTDTPPLNAGDVLTFSASISNTLPDETPADNMIVLNQPVNNSYDPNNKLISEGETITPSQIGDYLHYTINFQNLGTASATTIKVHDMIANNLDMTTFEIVGGSHSFRTAVSGNQVDFTFDNINLVSESVSEVDSQGFIAFKIKPANTVSVGSAISNNANIYFDYNFPIVTNTVTTTVTSLGINENTIGNHIQIYPNPVKNIMTIEANDIEIQQISIYNVLGQLVKTLPNHFEGNMITADISDLLAGHYIVQIVSDKGKASKKLVKL